MIVDGKVIVDAKVVTAFNDTHLAQMLGYPNITGLEVALLLNFREAKLDWKRVVAGKREEGRKGTTDGSRPHNISVLALAFIYLAAAAPGACFFIERSSNG